MVHCYPVFVKLMLFLLSHFLLLTFSKQCSCFKLVHDILLFQTGFLSYDYLTPNIEFYSCCYSQTPTPQELWEHSGLSSNAVPCRFGILNYKGEGSKSVIYYHRTQNCSLYVFTTCLQNGYTNFLLQIEYVIKIYCNSK